MHFRTGIYTAIVAAVAANPARLVAGGSSPSQIAVVSVYFDPQISAGTANRAQKLAANILERSGVRVQWISWGCIVPAVGLQNGAPDAAASTIVIRVLTQPRPGTVLSEDALGFTLVHAQPPHAAVFYDRVVRAAAATQARVEVVLGCAMAHEVGHALLSSSAHSRTGLMQRALSRFEFGLASHGQLLLKPNEIEAIRKRLAARGGSQNAT